MDGKLLKVFLSKIQPTVGPYTCLKCIGFPTNND